MADRASVQNRARVVVERFYAAIAHTDLAAAAQLLHQDALLQVPGNTPVSGTYRGEAGLREFTALTATLGDGGQTEILDVLTGKRHVAVYGITRAEREDRTPLANHTIHLVSVEHEKISAISIFNRDQATVDAFWA